MSDPVSWHPVVQFTVIVLAISVPMALLVIVTCYTYEMISTAKYERGRHRRGIFSGPRDTYRTRPFDRRFKHIIKSDPELRQLVREMDSKLARHDTD